MRKRGVSLKYDELNDILNSYFPNLRELIAFEINKSECYKPGPHVLYAKILNPYLKELLKTENNQNALQQTFEFFEVLAKSEDKEVRNLLQVTLLEALWDEKSTYEKSDKYMRPLTKQINRLIKHYLTEPM
jgi:hypothetical protein